MAAVVDICTGVATTVIQDIVLKAWMELRYLRKYKSYAKDFENEQGKLSATLESVNLHIDEAKKRNETLVDPRVEDWRERAKELLQQDTKPTKFFGLCTNCFSQITLAKELDSLTKELIPNLITEVHEFDAFARAAGVPGMEYYSQEFMHFESRKENFDKLKEELEDGNNYRIGLQGLGGTGKSTMAIEVGKHVEKSNPFDRVIFISVSTPVDEKGIRDDIAKQLELQLEEEKLLTHAQQIWVRIAHAGKVLIILDDVWEELDLNIIGIQHGIHNKGRCCVLLTARSLDVCVSMRCQKTLQLDVLPMEDALNLFLYHATASGNVCPNDLKKVARDIVDQCGGLPVMIVAVAKALKSWPPQRWQEALIVLKNPMPLRHGIVDEHKRKIYNSLRFSYDYLKDNVAQVLFLLCSIFPKAYEIPVELLSRITIGVGLFGEGDQYFIARSHVHEIINKLLTSSLLLKAGEEYVKVHDVIREMALEKIDNEKIQVITDSKTKLKESVKYSSWTINGFSNCFDDSKLEILLIWINANEYSLKVPKTVFEGMKSLRVLLLHSKIEFGRTSALLLPKSIQSLRDIRTLSLTNWELGDISVLIKNLEKLESLELNNCSIWELPNEISELKKLRFLCLIRCSLEENNPFDVIARCPQLEEVYYVSNDVYNIPIGAKVPQITSLPKYQIYHIDGSDFCAFDSLHLETSIKRSFKPAKMQRIFSKEIIKSLATRAEILMLEGDNGIGWNNLIPSMVSIEDGAMEDLINLSLISWSEMKCLIHTEHLKLKHGVTIFSKLAELQLDAVDLREICCGYYPDGFLKHLEKLELKRCRKLENTLFEGKLDLENLKSIEIVDCSMTCLFHPSTAQSLRQLETLKIAECSKLKYIIRDEKSSVEEKVGDEDPNLTSNNSVFSKLKLLSVKECGDLEFILPICFCEDLPSLEVVEIFECDNLRFMFGQYPKEGHLHQMQKETTLPSLKVMSIKNVPLFANIYSECYLQQKSVTNISEGSNEKGNSASRNVSWGPLCCFLPKSNTTNNNEPSTSKTSQPNHTTSQEKYIGNITNGVFTPPLYPCNLRKMNIEDISNFRSLFSVTIASSMSLLEELIVSDCDELEHIVIEEMDGHDHMNAHSIFLNLRTIEIKDCDNLEYVFPASCSRNLVHLESVLISGASQLKYVFGKSCGEDNPPNQNHTIEIDLSALNKLCLEEVPNIVSMCPENYYVKALSLQEINLDGCPQLPINSFIDLSVEVHKEQEQLSRKKVMGMQLCKLKHLALGSLEMETMYDLERLQIASPVDSSLETLWLEGLNMLRNICVGPKHLQVSFQNLSKLIIYRCHQLKLILSTPISRNLPYLRHLWVLQCKELECIIEDDDEACCFPNLHYIYVEDCESLKYLFSISTYGSLPQLSALYIGSAPELEQVFERKNTTQQLDIKHVFPILFLVTLIDLPKLHTICSAIDFQTIICRVVGNCPNLALTSIDTEFLESYWDWLEKSERNKGNMDELDLFEQIVNRVREIAEKTVKRDPPTAEQNSGSSNIKEIEETSDTESPESEADEGKDSEQTNKTVPVDAPLQIESPQKTMEPTSHQEGSKFDEVALTKNQVMEPESCKSSPTTFVVPSENECQHDNLVCIESKGKRITLDYLALPKTEHDMHHNDDSQKNIEAGVGETSHKIAMGSPSTTTEKSPPLVPSTSTSEKPQIATSSTEETKSESSQSDLLDTQEEIKVTQVETCKPCVSKQLENDDLLILFKIIEEGSNMEVHMPYASKIPADEYDSEVTKALADLDSYLKMDLNEIANSEENKHRLENALNTLSSHSSDDDLKATIHTLQQEIQTVLSSFKQAYATSNAVTKLEQKEKLMIGQSSHRKGAAMTLLSEIHKTQTREAELKEQISKLQAELHSKEKEIKECEVKLLSLEEKKKKSVSDTIVFIKELEAVKKERSQLENVNSRWSSCLANLKKTSLLLGVHLKQKL